MHPTNSLSKDKEKDKRTNSPMRSKSDTYAFEILVSNDDSPNFPNFFLKFPSTIHSKPTKMPTAGEANKGMKRTRPEDSQAEQLSKKSCDPKSDARAPKPKETPLAKKGASKVSGPTEAQVRHAEIVKKARADQAAQATLAAQAKAAKSSAATHAPSMPVISPAELLLNQLAGPSPGQTPAPMHMQIPPPIVEPGEQVTAEDEMDEEIVVTGQRALTPDPDRQATAPNNPHFTKEQKASVIDLNFAWVLSDDPRKALQIARNTNEIIQAQNAIKELEKVSLLTKKYINQSNQKYLPSLTQARQQALSG